MQKLRNANETYDLKKHEMNGEEFFTFKCHMNNRLFLCEIYYLEKGILNLKYKPACKLCGDIGNRNCNSNSKNGLT